MLAPSAYDALHALDEVLLDVFGVAIRKDDLKPLSRPGFDQIVRLLLRRLLAAVEAPEARVLQLQIDALDTKWTTLSERQRDSVIRHAVSRVTGVHGNVVPKVRSILRTTGREIVLGTKQVNRERHGLEITPSFHAADTTVIDHAAASQAFFLRDEYGRREQALSALARQVVARSLESGFDNDAIGRALQEALTAAGAKRTDAYWTMIASVFAGRARTWGTLSSFTEAGIDEYEIEATLDEQTCDVCRFMHGRTFTTSAGVASFEQVAAAGDPGAVVDLMPFCGVGVAPEGGRALFFGRGEDRALLATVVESGFGKRDAVGTYAEGIRRAAMESAGLICPFHPRCRCLPVPTGLSTGPVPAA